MIVPLLLLALVQQSEAASARAAEETVTETRTVKRIPNPDRDGSTRSPLVVAAENAKAARERSTKTPVKIDQQSVAKTTGRITITNPREITPPPPPPDLDEANTAQPQPKPQAKKPETKQELGSRLATLRAELARVSEDAESDSPQGGEQDQLVASQARIQAEIDRVSRKLKELPH